MIRVPDDIHARLRAAATERETTVTALLLDPWRHDPPQEVGPAPTPTPRRPSPGKLVAALQDAKDGNISRSRTVVVDKARGKATVVKAAPNRRGRLVGSDPITKEPIYR